MSGLPAAIPAVLVVVALAALVPAVLLSAGEAAVPRLGRSGMVEIAVTDTRVGRRASERGR